MMGTSSSLSEALSRSGLLGPAPRPPPPWPTTSSSTTSPSLRPPPPLLARAPLHMKKMPNEGGGTTATTAATTGNPYSKEKTGGGGRGDFPAIADPAKRRKRSAGDDDVLGEALEQTKRTRRSSGPSPAEYDDGPPSRDGGGRRPIVKVFNVGGYDGSVQVPKPSAILFRRTSAIALRTAVTPSPRDRAQPSAAILERQMHLAELLRREGGDAGGGGSASRSKVKILSSAGGGGGTEGGAARTTNATASSGGRNPCQNDGCGDFTSIFGGVLRSLFDM